MEELLYFAAWWSPWLIHLPASPLLQSGIHPQPTIAVRDTPTTDYCSRRYTHNGLLQSEVRPQPTIAVGETPTTE